jgi:hypothetical protein
MRVARLNLGHVQITVEQLVDIRQVPFDILRVRDPLKIRRQEFLLGVAEDFAERAINLHPVAVNRDKCHPRRMVEGTAKALFALLQGEADALLFGYVP